jgi:anaerobic selenocysteine-containing dehydrogenase
MEIKRRDFLKASVALGGMAMLGGCTLNALTGAKDEPVVKVGTKPGTWIPSACQGCTTWCPVEIFVQDGRAVKVRGNQLSKSHGGYACPRGHLLLQQLYDPDRIKVPMKRTNPQKGRGIDAKFVPISWDEAMGLIADKLLELRNANESHKLLVMRGRYSNMYPVGPYGAFSKIFGTPNNISHSALCDEAEKFGASGAIGTTTWSGQNIW